MNKLLPYETIVKAHEGDPDAIDTILSHYAGYIRYCSKVHGDLLLINKIQVFAASISTLVAFLSMFVIRYVDVNKMVHMKLSIPSSSGSVLIGGMLTGTYYCGNRIIQFVALCITAIYAVLTNVDILKSGVSLVKSRLGK